MKIKHVSILNSDKSYKNKNNKVSGVYSMRVYLSASPNQTWKSHFSSQWRKNFFYKQKKPYFINSEFRLLLEKGDDIQIYIETIKRLVERTNRLVMHEHMSYKKGRKIKLSVSYPTDAKVFKIV